jgi:sugar lactone lactonase YvrE
MDKPGRKKVMQMKSRHHGPPATLIDGWHLERLTPPSRLHGANGLATGPDGRLYCAQVPGSQVSAIDVDSGVIETISAMGSDIVAPDDLVFDDSGNMYLTEITEGRVCMRTPDGKVRVVQGDMPVANPITFHQGRLIAGECRVGARIMELDRNGGAPRVILADVPMANAFQVGPDGKLYFPVMGTNEIWRVNLDGSGREVVAGDLGVPDSVKFDSKGRIVSTQVMSGQVLRLDIQAGTREILADLGPGLDNVSFIGDRIFVSSIPGEITELLGGGKIREVVPRALQWPLGLAVGSDGMIFVVDGGFSYTLKPGGKLERAFMLFTPGGPGYARGVCAGAAPGEWIFTNGLGSVAISRPGAGCDFIANGYDQLIGVAANSSGAIVFAEYGVGRVHLADGGTVREIANGLDRPMGVAVDGSAAYVAEAGAGRVVKLQQGSPVSTVVDGLGRPEGIALHGGKLFIVDTLAKKLIEADPASGARRTLAENLPVGAPAGVTAKFLGPIGDMAGPMVPFAGIAAAADGTLYVSADAEGSVLAIRPA